jgi:AcrR family transcriptional regulator
MTGTERREQLLGIGRKLFAARGFEGTSIEEIAAQAGVSKPVVYEHFGGKEGLYAVVVDREVERLLTTATEFLSGAQTREKFEAAAVALLRYIEDNADGFRILVRDSHPASGGGNFGSLISDIASQVEYILGDFFRDRGYEAGPDVRADAGGDGGRDRAVVARRPQAQGGGGRGPPDQPGLERAVAAGEGADHLQQGGQEAAARGRAERPVAAGRVSLAAGPGAPAAGRA